jgi:hypothetical protein
MVRVAFGASALFNLVAWSASGDTVILVAAVLSGAAAFLWSVQV